MRYTLALLIFCALSCSQSGGLSKGGNSTRPAGDEDGDNSSSSAGDGSLSGIALRYRFPNIPTESGAEQYYLTSFGNTELGQAPNVFNPKTEQNKLAAKIPPSQLKIDLVDEGDGVNYCFSNDKYSGGPNCRGASENIVRQIKAGQATPTGKHPVFITALQFNFRNALKSKGGNYSEVVWTGAKIEKSPIVIVKSTGLLAKIESQHIMTLSYGTGGPNCNVADKNSVGFNALTYMEDEYYLSGVWSFERAERQVFGESSQVQQPSICHTANVGDYYCNLFADKVSVWHALLLPVLYSNGNVTHRQFPNDRIVDSALVRDPKSEQVKFGRYSENDAATYFTTPAMGKNDANGVEIPNWQKYFIRKFCMNGYRKEKDQNGNEKITPLVQAMRFELRSPYIKKFRN